jgi:uncharacterized protein YjbI with pentapeptide repeats
MANAEHVAVVRQGADAIFDWRKGHAEPLDISGADFSRASLSFANLEGARVENVKFRGATLRNANLYSASIQGSSFVDADLSHAFLVNARGGGSYFSYADLTSARLMRADFHDSVFDWADLRDANLEGAKLSRASFEFTMLHHASLQQTDLTDAILTYSNLGDADLDRANLSRALIGATVFGGTNLRHVAGLESCTYIGRSALDFATLQVSGLLPLRFLRGCGLADQLIDYLPSLLQQAIEYYSCFISYSHRDEEFTKRLHADLQDNGVRCWFAPEDLKIGDRFRVRIDESIRLHDKLLLILSGDSVGSQWVEQEVETALETERKAKARGEDRTVLFPVRLDDAVTEIEGGWPALVRNTRHIGDFTRWKDHDAYRAAFERLLRDLKAGDKAVPPA